MVLHESPWPGGHSRQHQDFPVAWHHFGVFHCLPAPACLQQGWRAMLSPRQMFRFHLLRSVQTEDPSPPLLSCIQKSRRNGCTASKPASQGRPAGEARWRLLCSSCRSEICCSSQPFTVIVLGQTLCTLGKRGRRQQERFFTLKEQHKNNLF